jgi:spoIIIJ-associated protein
MGVEAEVVVVEEADRVVLDIECEDVERVIGRRGQVVDALQHLVGKVASQGRAAEAGRVIVVDAGGYRAKHVERLQQLAERMSEKALRGGSAVALNPMTAHDRRIVHMRVAEIAGVETRSEGSGEQRHVVIFPKPGGEQPAVEAKESEG